MCVSARWEALGSSVVLRVTRGERIAAARAAVQRELDAVERACSRFRADSELSRANAGRGRCIGVSELFAQALELALRAAELTDGDVDPTVGRALELAGYDRDWQQLARDDGRPQPQPQPRPTADAPIVLTARVHAGWRTIALDRQRLTVRVPHGVTLDLGATAKAWAADRCADAAARAAGCGALVSLGGDIATAGPAPAGGWTIHVTDDHRSDCSAPGQTVSIRCGGLATSSTSVRRWRHRGQSMHHIVDPRTGAPVRARWRTVSVAAASCADANIAATAAIVRAGRAPDWLARAGLPARLVSHTGAVSAVAGWPGETAAR